MISIAIINLKGGVGKSVTACNLAAELAAKSKSVLVVDLDKQGNTSKFFGVLDYDSPSIAEIMLGVCRAPGAVVDTNLAAVNLIPCDMRMLKANRMILMDNGPRQYHLRDALKDVSANYDYCIMDCPPDLDMGSINALCAADWVIIPVDCDEWACDGMREIIDQIEQVQIDYNPRLKIMGALLTKYRRTRYAADVIHTIAEKLPGLALLPTVIRYTVRVSEAKSAHKPLRTFSPDCTAALDYKALAEKVESIVSNVDTEED
jgi:chromosome partitioning protein